jgi:hypothetical protein
VVGHLGEQYGGGEVVVLRELGGVEDLSAPSDHRGLMADDVDPLQGGRDRTGIPQVPPAELDTGRHLRRRTVVGVWKKCVENANFVPLTQELFDNMRADEPGPTGDENPHQTSLRTPKAGRRKS